MQQILIKKQIIDGFLLNFLKNEEVKFQKQELASEAFAKIKDFVIGGKTIRGGLFLAVCEALDPNKFADCQEDFLQVATALELIHSGLLIHDDIIDQDEKRRGKSSVWHQYEEFASNKNYKDPKNYGQSLAICVGNIAFYLANQSLEQMSSLSNELCKKIKQIINQEIIKTNFAEMLDSKITLNKETPSLESVKEMYLFKTARYTFSLPLYLAGVSNELSEYQIEKLIQFGEKLGLIFQIKDDEMSLFASEAVSGKSFASDIREGKKTIFYLYLINKINDEQKDFLLKNYGNKKINKNEIEQIQELFYKYSLPEIKILISQLENEAKEIIQQTNLPNITKLLEDMLAFNINRSN